MPSLLIITSRHSSDYAVQLWSYTSRSKGRFFKGTSLRSKLQHQPKGNAQ